MNRRSGCGISGLILVLLLLCCGGFFGVIFWATSGAASTTDAFFTAVQEDQYGDAYQLLSPQQQDGFTTEMGLAEHLGRLPDDIESWSKMSRNVSCSPDCEGEIAGDLTLTNGDSFPYTTYLEKTEGEWVITEFDIDGLLQQGR